MRRRRDGLSITTDERRPPQPFRVFCPGDFRYRGNRGSKRKIEKARLSAESRGEARCAADLCLQSMYNLASFSTDTILLRFDELWALVEAGRAPINGAEEIPGASAYYGRVLKKCLEPTDCCLSAAALRHESSWRDINYGGKTSLSLSNGLAPGQALSWPDSSVFLP